MGYLILGFVIGALFGMIIFALICADVPSCPPIDIRYDYDLGYKDGYNDAKKVFAPKGKAKERDNKGGN